VGLCFEDAPLLEHLAEGARRLARAAGYFGLFQLEFVCVGDRHFLIDFNPRFYNQLAFDVARGLPLPQIIHAAARGDRGEVRRLVRGAAAPPGADELVFCNRFGFEFMLAAQRLAGRASSAEVRRWRRWRRDHAARAIDPTATADDAVPAIVDAATQVYECARHPRAFLRGLLSDPGRA
jgi:hypothetical protein